MENYYRLSITEETKKEAIGFIRSVEGKEISYQQKREALRLLSKVCEEAKMSNKAFETEYDRIIKKEYQRDINKCGLVDWDNNELNELRSRIQIDYELENIKRKLRDISGVWVK